MSEPNTSMVNNIKYVREDSISKPGQVARVKSVQKHPYFIGQQYYIQTVTHYYVGTLSAVTDQELVLTDAAWVADSGRHNEFMKGAKPKELEPCNGPAIINRGALIAAMPRKSIIEVI